MTENYPFEVTTGWMFCQKLSWFIATLVYIPKCSSGTSKDYVRYPSGKILELCFVFEWSNNKTFLMEKKMKGTDESLVWHLHRALPWISPSAAPTPLPQSCSTPQAGHYDPSNPSISDIVTDHQNGSFNPFYSGYPKDNTNLSYSVTALEGLWQIWLEATREFSSMTEKLDLSASTFLNVKGAKTKINQTSSVWKNNVLKNVLFSVTL